MAYSQRDLLRGPLGEDLGHTVFAPTNWQPGDVIPRGAEGSLRVLEVIREEDDDTGLSGVLVVEPV
jgi:hypothetical protein